MIFPGESSCVLSLVNVCSVDLAIPRRFRIVPSPTSLAYVFYTLSCPNTRCICFLDVLPLLDKVFLLTELELAIFSVLRVCSDG